MGKTPGYLYLVQPERFLGTNIFKVGKTEREPEKRFSEYGKDTLVLECVKVEDIDNSEKTVINFFSSAQKYKDGNEYFECKNKDCARVLFFEAISFLKKEWMKSVVLDEKRREILIKTILGNNRLKITGLSKDYILVVDLIEILGINLDFEDLSIIQKICDTGGGSRVEFDHNIFPFRDNIIIKGVRQTFFGN